MQITNKTHTGATGQADQFAHNYDELMLPSINLYSLHTNSKGVARLYIYIGNHLCKYPPYSKSLSRAKIDFLSKQSKNAC